MGRKGKGFANPTVPLQPSINACETPISLDTIPEQVETKCQLWAFPDPPIPGLEALVRRRSTLDVDLFLAAIPTLIPLAISQRTNNHFLNQS